MKRQAAFAWAAAGVIVPAVVLLDLNVLGGTLSSYHPSVILVMWPSSFMLSGFSQVNAAAIAGLAISVGINVILYLLVGLVLSRILMLLKGRSRQH